MASAKRGTTAATRHGDLRLRRRRRRVASKSLAVTLTVGTLVTYWAWSDDATRNAPGSYRPLAGVGHGRGMSQFGAFDQAASGARADGILMHYYPGATLTTIAPTIVRVRLMSDDNETLDVYADSGLTVAGRRVVTGQVAHLTPTPDRGASVVITSGCAGDVLWQGATDDPWAYPIDPGPDRPAAEHLKVCDGGTYRGALGVALDDGSPRTVDQVDTEDYLRGVVPTEMSADWADQGATEALRAQAIAARSYALAEHRYPYAQTCDTEDCQAYSGTEKEDARSDAAVRDTAGQVLLRDGRLLRSEYSSAPGGGRPIDINTLEVGPAPDELTPAPAAPESDNDNDGVQRSVRANTAIDVKYTEIGGPAGPLGEPIGPESLLPDSGGTFRLFRNGVIIATPTLGARVVDFSTLMQVAPDAGRGGAAPGTVAPSTASTPTPPPSPAPPLSTLNGRSGQMPQSGPVPRSSPESQSAPQASPTRTPPDAPQPEIPPPPADPNAPAAEPAPAADPGTSAAGPENEGPAAAPESPEIPSGASDSAGGATD